ncbi:hypothetical protein BJ165DRAFT_1568716 [Panaeolus papilionaceus]|nr:hypothetical protein BJ165DRAFT_1568716 [Panaeolus papilionaceus]
MDVEHQVQASEKPTSTTENNAGITAAPTRASQTPAIAEQQGPQPATSSSEIAPPGAPMDVDTDLSNDPKDKAETSSMPVVDAQAPVDTSMVVDAPPAASASSSTQDAPPSLTEEKEVSSILQAEKTSASPSQESQDPPTQVPDDDDDEEEEEEASDDPTLSKSLHNRVPTSPLSDLPRGYSFDLGGYGDDGETPNDLLLPSTPPPTASGSSAVPDPDDEPQGHRKKRTADRLSPSVSPTEKPKRKKRRNRGLPKPQNAAPYVNANLNKRLATIGDNFISGMSQENRGTRGRQTQPSTPANRNNSRASSSRRPPQPPAPTDRNDPGAGPSRRPPQPPGPTSRNDPGAGSSGSRGRPTQPSDPASLNNPGAGPSRRSTRPKPPHTPR